MPDNRSQRHPVTTQQELAPVDLDSLTSVPPVRLLPLIRWHEIVINAAHCQLDLAGKIHEFFPFSAENASDCAHDARVTRRPERVQRKLETVASDVSPVTAIDGSNGHRGSWTSTAPFSLAYA